MTHITQFDNRHRSPIETKISPHKFLFFVDISTLFRLFIEVTPFTIDLRSIVPSAFVVWTFSSP